MTACKDMKTVADGIALAPKFGAPNLAKVYVVYNTYRAWIERYRGSIPGISVAQGILHESGANPLSTSDKDLKESGLWSVLESVARTQNIDPFDPEANIWGGAYLRSDRVRQLVADPAFSWLKDASAEDWTRLVWKMPGSLGFGGWKVMMQKIFPSPPPKGSAQRQYPYQYMRTWLLSHPGQVPQLGKMGPGVVACRMLRDSDTPQLAKLGQLAVPGEFKLIPRPAHLSPFNQAKFNKVWGTPKLMRPVLFPEYLRTPGEPQGRSSSTALVAATGALAFGLATGYVGYLSYRERGRYAAAWHRLWGRRGR